MKIKSWTFGFIAGVLAASTVTAFGLQLGSGMVEAYLQDTNVRMIIDGKTISLPSDTHILNYGGRVYTPTRLVAESLNAQVEWEDASRAVIIKSNYKEPAVVEKVETVEVQVPLYAPLPQKRIKNGMSINLVDYDTTSIAFNVFFEYRNEASEMVMLNLENAYIEHDGVRYGFVRASGLLATNSVVGHRLITDCYLTFEPVPLDAREVTLVVPIEFGSAVTEKTGFKYEFNILLDE